MLGHSKKDSYFRIEYTGQLYYYTEDGTIILNTVDRIII